MIAACPNCKTRYRIEPERLGDEGARLRCKRCDTVFRVRPPRAAPAIRGPEPTPAEPAGARSQGPGASGSSRRVLVAHPEPAACKRIAEALAAMGLEALQAHDGVEAILTLQRTLPRAVILEAGLPKMYGFQVCELVKRNESLRSTWVILIGSQHHPDRYHRPANDLYGADAYLAPGEVLESLPGLLRGFGLPLEGAGEGPREAPHPAAPGIGEPVTSEPAAPSTAPSPPEPVAEPAPTPGTADDELAAERAKAERLARIIVSDIVLYNEEKFRTAVESGDPVRAMEEELDEGRTLFRERIDPRVRDERDHLVEELLRVARSRGMP